MRGLGLTNLLSLCICEPFIFLATDVLHSDLIVACLL